MFRNINLKYFILILFLFLIIDIPMITLINSKMYQIQFNRINNGPMRLGSHTIVSAIFAYLLLALGLYYFVVNPAIVNNTSITNSFYNGVILGFVIYGVYNGTNKATINEFGTIESIVDTIWGSVLSGLLSVLSIYLIRKFKL